MNDLFTLVPILLIIGGIVSIVSPKTAWYLQEGWKYKRAKNLEPSDAALLVIRISGV